MKKCFFERRCKYSIRKFSLGVASVMIGVALFGAGTVLADTPTSGSIDNLPPDLVPRIMDVKLRHQKLRSLKLLPRWWRLQKRKT